MSTLNWDELVDDLHGEDVDLALAASEQIAANVTAADLPRIYALAEDEDYFVRVMAGDILAKTAGITALPTLLAIMLRNEEEGFDNDGLDHATKALIDANPITARTTLEQFARNGSPVAKTIADWGLAGVPEESTVVTPLVAAPPAPPVTWLRSCLVRLGIVVALLIVGVGAWGYVPPLGNGADCTKGNHAAWLSVDWTSNPVDLTSVRRLRDESSRYRLRYLYPYTTYLQEDGTFNDTYAYADEFVQAFRSVNDDTLLLAWVGIPLRNPRNYGVPGWVDLSDSATRRDITTFVVRLVEENGFDGVHLNVETVWNDDPNFLLLLDEVQSALGEGLLVSVAGSHWSPEILEPLELRWSDTYYHDVAARVEQIATMTYDSRSPHPAIYRFWMREQVRGIAHSIAPTGAELLIGVSVSDEATSSHNPTTETLADGLAGTCAGGNALTDGVALYAAWETDEAEWATWQRWLE
jgi:hypothetical protein